MHKVKVTAHDFETGRPHKTTMDLGIGGQCCYNDGPSVLLTLEDRYGSIEAKIPFEFAGQLAEMLVHARDSWSEAGCDIELVHARDSWNETKCDIEPGHECKCNDSQDCESCAECFGANRLTVYPSKFLDYKVVDIRNFTEVQKMLVDGWEPWGSPIIDKATSEPVTFRSVLQAFVKRG